SVEGVARPGARVDAGGFGKGEKGAGGGRVGFAVDPVDVPAAPQGLPGEGEGGDRLAAAGFPDDEGLAAPAVERRRYDGAPAVHEPPVLDDALEGDAEDGAALGFWPSPGPSDGALRLGAAAAGLAEFAVVAGGFVFVAVMD